jgi:hypothetical protein
MTFVPIRSSSFAGAARLARALAGVGLAATALTCKSPGSHGPSSGTGGSVGTRPTGAALCTATAATSCVEGQQGCAALDGGDTCLPCGAGTYAANDGSCVGVPGTPLSHTFPEQTTTAGQEVTGLCRSWTVDNDQDLWVNSVEIVQDELSHHANFTYVPDSDFTGPDGIWKCSSRSYEIWSGVAAGGLLFSQSTQATHEVQRFGAGAALHLPAHVRIISDVHLLNTSASSNTGHATLTLYGIPAAQVTAKLVGFHVEYDALTIAPLATSRFTGTCNFASAVATAQGSPFAPKIHYVLPHTHTLATSYSASVLGGPLDGSALVAIGMYNGEAHGRGFDPPIDMTGAQGITLMCQYTNTLTTAVGWGTPPNEMCELFGFAEAPDFFRAWVPTGTAMGKDASGVLEFKSSDCPSAVIPAPM